MPKDEALEALARPLRFAARNRFENLSVVKNLEKTLSTLLERVSDAALRARLAEHVSGFDGADHASRAARAQRILALIDGAPAANGAPAEPQRPVPQRKAAQTGLKRMRAKERVRRGFLDELSLVNVKGVGPKTAERLAARGVSSVLDALLYLPRGYEDRRHVTPIAELEPGAHAVVRGEVLQAAVKRGRKRMFEAAISDGSGTLNVKWFRFNQKALQGAFQRGSTVTLSGGVTSWGAMRQMVHPDVEVGDVDTTGAVLPIYPEIEGVAAKNLRKILQDVARLYAKRVEDPLPSDVRERLELPELASSIEIAHVPEGDVIEEEGGPDGSVIRRLVFDELFYLQLALGLRSSETARSPGLENRAPEPWRAIAERILPYTLTGAQARSLEEITRDMAEPRPMNRLLQGDVGSGKTAVAMVAAAVAHAAGRQTAILAPTEILAEQHFVTARQTLGAHGIDAELLTGSTTRKERAAILERLASGDLPVLIGTHALIEPDVRFDDLGLSIVDEQHRFGVAQRAALRMKSRSEELPPDVLVMTATPIPRTMALTVYGDLAVSIIDELPPGRSPVATRVFREDDRRAAYRIVEAALERGEQAYVVFPLVERSENSGDLKAATKALAGLEKRFPKHRVELLHGRMKGEEKSLTMDRFRRGETRLLVATTVIEVGVDVPNSTVLVLENAERFGLSQVHQLRGRVGRGEKPGECLLIVAGGGQDAWQRLEILESTSDGFVVAEADLRFRGPGEILGTRQSGLPLLMMADLVRDAALLEEARREAFALVEQDPSLDDHVALKHEVERRLAGSLGLVDVG